MTDREKVKELKNALKFYADKNSYEDKAVYTIFGVVYDKLPILKDNGDIARKVLEWTE